MGNKEVIIDTKGNERKRISFLLTIVDEGSKLPAVLIFKGKKVIIIEKEINGNMHVLRKEIFALVQENSWCDSQIFSFWYKNIFLNYEKKINKKCLLILDKAPNHIDNDILEKFKLYKTHYVYIPGGLTKYQQVLDIELIKFLNLQLEMNIVKLNYLKKKILKIY